jgi:hypothetical protein
MKINGMIKQCVVFLCLVLTSTAFTQTSANYELLKSSGAIPDHFLERSESKYKTQLAEISREDSRYERKIQKRFYLESNYLGSQLLMSGKVLVNDPIGAYINQIADVLLKHDKELRSQLNFYVVKSPIVNAFATDQGNIFINMGLIAKVKSEAQLAYIMCHEIIHFQRKHSIQRYVESEKIDENKGVYTQESLDDKIFLKSFYVKAQETEADSLGFLLFSKSEYSLSAATEALALLGTYDLPFDQKSSNYIDFFTSPNFPLDSAGVMPLDSFSRKEYTSDFETHPAVPDRVAKIQGLILQSDTTSNHYIVSNELFSAHQLTARFEIAHYFLRKGAYYEALYCAYNLKLDYPDNQFLNDIVAKSIYGISRSITLELSLEDLESDWVDYSKKVSRAMKYNSPEIQQLHYFLSQVDRKRFNQYAIDKLWQDYQSEKSEVTKLRLSGLLKDYHKHSKKESDTSQFDLVNTPSLMAIHDPSTEQNTSPQPKKRKRHKKNRPGIKNLIVLDPNYLKFDLRKENQVKYIASERSLNQYHEGLNKIANLLDMNVHVLSPASFDANDVEKFNDMALLNSYFEEKNRTPFDNYSADYEAIQAICNRYGTDQLALLGTLSFHLDKDKLSSIFLLAWTAIVFPALPMGVYNITVPQYRTFNYAFVFDLTQSTVVFNNVHRTKLNDISGTVKSALYYNLRQISR